VKKLTVFMIAALLIAGTAFAQPIKEQREAELRDQQEKAQRQDRQRNQQNRQMQDNSVSVEGTLKLEKGFVAVQNEESVYLVPMLNRYIGFIDGLKEGEKISIEGRGFKDMIQPLKVTIGEKSYDFIAPPHGSGFKNQGFNHHYDKRDKPHNNRFDNKKHGHKFEKKRYDCNKEDRYNKSRSR